MTQSDFDLKAAVLSILSRHVGKERAIHGRELAQMLGLKDDRVIREIRWELMQDGHPILASSSAGFWYAESRAEVEECRRELRSRLKEIAIHRARLKRVAALYFDGAKQGRLV
jgi:hypothetical protein